MKCLMPGGINEIHELFNVAVLLQEFLSIFKSRALLFFNINDRRVAVSDDLRFAFPGIKRSYKKYRSIGRMLRIPPINVVLSRE